MGLDRKDLLGIEDLSKKEIELILSNAKSFKEILARPIKKVPTLRGKSIITLFFEPSTRTRSSFEIAAKVLSADTLSLTASASSVVKGETLIDTVKNMEAMKPDIMIVRHSSSGAPHLIAKNVKASVVNAGDGWHEHPTQALLDMFTMIEAKGKIEGLKVSIMGDILHSRVARSNMLALTKMGADVTVFGPSTMIPQFVEKLGVRVAKNIDSAIEGADIIMMLRIQLERQKESLFPTLREFAKFYGLSVDRLKGAKKDVVIMHPGPMNRGVEIQSEVADGPYSVILDQVTNGVAVRMAVLYLLCGQGEENDNS
jgi:aspartate carbamoyltransferase catalytic subunit